MNEKLTTEFVKSVELPFNPIARHRQVWEMVTDPNLVGDWHVEFNPVGPVRAEHNTIIAHTLMPLLGRRALAKVAQTIEVINNQG